MKKKLLLMSTILFCTLFLITGCGNKDEKTSTLGKSDSYYSDLDYDTLMAAANSEDDDFVVLIYRDNFWSNEIDKALKDYANSNKQMVYRFDLDAYLEEYKKAHKNEIKEGQESFVSECMAETTLVDTPTEEENTEIVGETTGESETIINVEENTVTYDFTNNYDTCVNSYEEQVLAEQVNEIYNRFSINESGTAVYMKSGFIYGTFTNFIPASYPWMAQEAKEAALEQSTKDLTKWLNDVFNK